MRGLPRIFTRQSFLLVQVVVCVLVFFMAYRNSTKRYKREVEDLCRSRNITLPRPDVAFPVPKTKKNPVVSAEIKPGDKHINPRIPSGISDNHWSNVSHSIAQNDTGDRENTNLNMKALTIVASFQNFPPDDYLARSESFFVLRDSVVNDLDPRWLIQNSPCLSEGPFLLVVVPSVDEHAQHRKAIRATWASPAYGQPWPGFARPFKELVKVVFFLGVASVEKRKDLIREAELHDDIVQGDFSDTYQNLSLKMTAVLRWSATYCPSAGHVMKVDEDTFVNLPLLLYVLKLSSYFRSNYVLGYKHAHAQPPVVRAGKWGVSKEIYPLSTYPRYLYGHSYVISGDAIQRLYHASRHMPLVPNEDSYVTGMLAKSAEVLRVHSDKFAYAGKANTCDLINNKDITQTHFKNPTAFLAMWEMIQTRNCSRPFL
ncbi:beta-1,3-galactosyltransferase 5-like [Littorina saxatilis]|uniref:Hexosyltransferase n=1 Tax=Littorina saxatilis TaxID=31220 RepID=A0AAN9GMI4_9CAEN